MIEVRLNADEDFLKIRETLTRIGLPDRNQQRLTQSCHIVHKRGRYYIASFKELYELDGQVVQVTEEDLRRRDSIAHLLEQWGLCDIAAPTQPPEVSPMFIVIPYNERDQWTLKSNYTFNKKGRGHAKYSQKKGNE